MILLVTRIWPTRDRPSMGAFVRDRVRGIPTIRVVRPRRSTAAWPILYPVLLLDAVRSSRAIRGVEAHVVVPTGLIGWLVARLRRVPVVVYAHGGDVRDYRSRALPIRWLTRFVVRHAERVVTNSSDSAAHIRAMGVEPSIVPPGVDVARFRVEPRPATRRVLYLGGANPRKGYDVALGLADTLVGPWLRDVDPADVPELIAEHDIVLVPSYAEPFGLVAVEALASGRWVVARAVGGLRDIITDGVNGTLVTDDDFAGALARVPDYDPAAVARTAERFGLQRWQAEMARLWDEVAGPYTPSDPARPSPQEDS